MALFGLFSKKGEDNKEPQEKTGIKQKIAALKAFTELDVLEYLLRFKEFNTGGLKLAQEKLTTTTLTALKEFLTREKIEDLETPMDDTSANILVLDLYRMKERTRKGRFSPRLHMLVVGKFRQLKDSAGNRTLKQIMLHCVNTVLAAKPATPQQSHI